jgi:hypothetical protein
MSTAPSPAQAAPKAAKAPAPAAPSVKAPRSPALQTSVAAPVAAQARSAKQFAVKRGIVAEAHKIVIYGPGGVGKTELCSLLTEVGIEPLFIDLEGSSSFLDVARLDPAPTMHEEVRDALHSDLSGFGAVVVDSVTKLEEIDREFVIRTIPHEKGSSVRIESIEDYGWGKGYMHIYETMMLVLQDLDAIARKGIHVILVAHELTEKVPNPAGEDFLQYQPRLQSPPKQGKLRERIKEWCDHLFYIGFDRFVSKDGKATGGGSRTIYPIETATHWAKSRLLTEAFEYSKGDAKLWRQLFGG